MESREAPSVLRRSSLSALSAPSLAASTLFGPASSSLTSRNPTHCTNYKSSPSVVLSSLDHLLLVVKMIRAGAARALYAVTRTQLPRQLPAFRNQVTSSLLRSSRVTPSFVIQSIRCYSAPAGLSKDEAQGRIMDLLKNFDKVRLEKPSPRE